MRYPLLIKIGAIGAVMVALLLGLDAICGIVNERQMRLQEAQRSVADSLAGEQTVLGPLLVRSCRERWDRTVVNETTKERSVVHETRDFILTAWPRSLNVAASAAIEPRYRGLFRVNSFLSRSHLIAEWADLQALEPRAEQPGGQLQCEAPNVLVSLSDARGIRAASMTLDAATKLTVLPGSLLRRQNPGFHATLDARAADAPLHLDIALDLAGTSRLAWAPVGSENRVQLNSDWPHPSFDGRFLPVERKIGPQGFDSQWQVSALATSAQQTLRCDSSACDLGEGTAPVIDTFGVSFIDPVSGYVLSDRALKYGLLFIALTFVGVGLVEVMRRVRVHPVQYLLVGSALTLFFLLLLSLSEHLSFGAAYLAAGAACCSLLGYYGAHILRGWRPGLVFGSGIALLYGALYALLQLEQTALVLGSLLLFVVLGALMVATRRIDWYRMTAPGISAATPAS